MRPFLPEPDLSERVHDAVLDAICSGELKSGARITQEELANQFGVSRQPVLQAMMLLRREGFLIDAGRKGVAVAPLDMQQVRNLIGEIGPQLRLQRSRVNPLNNVGGLSVGHMNGLSDICIART